MKTMPQPLFLQGLRHINTMAGDGIIALKVLWSAFTRRNDGAERVSGLASD
jgi:hypothetical protein